MAELFEIQAGGVVYDVIDAKALRKPLTEGTLGQIPANDGNGGTVWTDPQSGPGGSFNIHTLTQENNVEDNDEFVLYDLSALSHRKTLWSNIKALLKTYFDSIYATASALMGKQDLIDSSHKLSYNLLSGTPTIPDELADLTEDATHRTVTDTEKSTWNAKGTYSKPLGGIPESDLSQFLSDKINSRLVEIITLTETNGVISASLTFDEIAEYYSNGVMMFVKVGWRDEFRYFCTLEDVMFENLHCKKFTFSAMGSDHILFSYTVDRNNTWEYYEAELAKLDDVIERPGDAGEAGQVLMTDGDGGTSWATPYGNTFDIHALQNQNAIDDGDEIAIYDVSVDSNRKTTWSNIISKIQTALSSAFSGKADKVSGSHTNEIAILDSGGNVQAGGKTLSDLIEQPAVAGTDGQVLTSDGQGGVAWETPQGGGSDTSTIQEVSATALTDLNERVERLNGGHLRTATGFKKVLTVEDYLSIYGVFATNLTTNLNNQGLAASQGKYLKDLSDVNEQILANALVELALGVTIWRNIAAEFSPSTAYNVGDYCFYSGILYRCTTSASASPTFDNTKFEQTTVMAEIIRLTTNA